MRKRILALLLACLLLSGCGPQRTEPVQAPLATEGSTIAYVPLDDRPDNVGRVVYLAESLGYVLEMPEADWYHTCLDGQPTNANGTQYGNRAALYEWVLEQEAAGCDRYVLFLDQLLSGGLVNSRHMTEFEAVTLSDGTTMTEIELLESLLSKLAADEENRVWLLDSVMRLAPTVGYAGFGLEEYNALRAYGMEPRPELRDDETELHHVVRWYGQGADRNDLAPEAFDLTGKQVTEYINARVRKLELSNTMMETLETLEADRFRVLIGIDDSSAENSIQKNEIAFLRSQLREGDALLSGVDDLAFKAVSKLYLEEIEWQGATACVRYYGGTENQPACAYDYKPLEEIVAEHLDFFGLKAGETPAASDFMVLVLTQPEDPEKKAEYYEALIQEYQWKREAHMPVILIDAGNGQYGTAFHEALTEKAELGWLLSYAGFLDMAIVTGTALSHGVARYAFLHHGEQTAVTEQAFARTLADSILKDFCYKHIVRNDILAYVRNDLAGSADNFWQPELDLEKIRTRLKNGMDTAVQPVIDNLERSNMISALPFTREYAERGWGGVETAGYYFPWDRAFEIEMEILLGDFTEPHKNILGVYYQ